MKVLNPIPALVPFKFIPRRYDFGTLSYLMINEENQVEIEDDAADNLDSIAIDSKGYLSFNLYTRNKGDLTKRKNWVIKIFDTDGVIYRGKIYFTESTDLQNFSLTPINNNVIEL